MTDKLTAVLILEILGKPPEHLKKVLGEMADKIGAAKDVKIIDRKIAEPKPLEDKDLFTSFAELEVQTDLKNLMGIIFGSMPSHIEITEPEQINMSNSETNLFFNELLRRLHQYDELAKALMLERQAIVKQIQEGKIKIEPPKKETKNTHH